jgi:hypothetical protein
MLSCEILKLKLEEDIQTKINSWLVLNKTKTVKFIQHTHIPPIIIIIPENDPIRKEQGMQKAAFTEKPGYMLISLYYESKDF